MYIKIRVNVDTTVETIYGDQQGGRKGYNTKHCAKETYRPVVCFIEETREYLTGKLRKGVTMSGQEAAALIKRSDSVTGWSTPATKNKKNTP